MTLGAAIIIILACCWFVVLVLWVTEKLLARYAPNVRRRAADRTWKESDR